jgi:hypothetical protein
MEIAGAPMAMNFITMFVLAMMKLVRRNWGSTAFTMVGFADVSRITRN